MLAVRQSEEKGTIWIKSHVRKPTLSKHPLRQRHCTRQWETRDELEFALAPQAQFLWYVKRTWLSRGSVGFHELIWNQWMNVFKVKYNMWLMLKSLNYLQELWASLVNLKAGRRKIFPNLRITCIRISRKSHLYSE